MYGDWNTKSLGICLVIIALCSVVGFFTVVGAVAWFFTDHLRWVW